MQGAPGYALDGFIRNAVVDLWDIKTIQGKSCSTWPLFASNWNLRVQKQSSWEHFTAPHTWRHRALSPHKEACLPCNTCWSELLLLRKWDDTLSHAGGWGCFPPIPAAQSWRLPCSIRFKIFSALRFSFSLLVRPLTAEMCGSLIVVLHHTQGKQGWEAG